MKEKIEILKKEVTKHLKNKIIPFWKNMRDDSFGGYFGYMDFNGNIDRKAPKGCILNSRILWFFSNAYMALGDKSLKREADHAYEFMKSCCIDKEYGGLYWAVSFKGEPTEVIKHTYNQAFGIYALSSYYRATGKKEALETAESLFRLVEEKCCDKGGYLESFERDFKPQINEKLSENGVIAERTMNTLLHVFEAYTELYIAKPNDEVLSRLKFMAELFRDKVYNPNKRRLEVFFDRNWNSLIDLHSYGHDIEACWLLDRGLDAIGDQKLKADFLPITAAIEENILNRAYVNSSVLNECEKGADKTNRVWWIQAESVVGFYNAWQKSNKKEYIDAALEIWDYIKEYVVDKREFSEWFWEVSENGEPVKDRPIAEPWKCPYHNGRMCMELIKRKPPLL